MNKSKNFGSKIKLHMFAVGILIFKQIIQSKISFSAVFSASYCIQVKYFIWHITLHQVNNSTSC